MAQKPSPKRALRAAEGLTRDIAEEQRRWLGPRGLLSRYEQQWRAMVREGFRQAGARGAILAQRGPLDDLRRALLLLAKRARERAEARARQQLRALGLPEASPEGDLAKQAQENEAAAMAAMEARLQFIEPRLYTIAVGVDDGQEFGQRIENWRPVRQLQHDLSVLLPQLFLVWALAWLSAGAQADPLGRRWMKQAVATIDQHTTETCLLVHGQVKPFDEPFELAGQPRFADRMMRPPFHWHCRTSVVLYLPEYDGGLTEQMKAAAQAEIEARAQGKHAYRSPVSSALGGP